MQKDELDINVAAVKAGNMTFTGRRSSSANRRSPAYPGSGHVTALRPCPRCPCPDAQRVLSRHLTADGLLAYTRCWCGALHLWLWPHDAGAARHIARGGRSLG